MDEGIIEEISRKTPIGGSLARVYLKKTCHNTHKNLKARVERNKKARYTQRVRIVWVYRKKEARNVPAGVDMAFFIG